MNIYKITPTLIADGQTGDFIKDTILNPAITNLYNVVQYDFQQSDADSGGDENQLTINHNFGVTKVIAKLYDSSWIEQDINGLFSIIDTNNVQLTWTDTLTELYHLIIDYRK